LIVHCPDCDNTNGLCLGNTVSWSSNAQWIYTDDLPEFINAYRKYDAEG